MILVQLVLMVILLFVLMIPLLRNQLTPQALGTYSSLRLRRLLTEEEVIAEFLRSEFHHPEFDDYRHEFESLVKCPNLR